MQVLFDLRIQGIGLNVPITFADYPITRSLEGIKDCWNVGKQIEYTLFLDNWYYFTLAYPDVHCPCVLEKSVTNWKVVISTILMTFHKKVVVFQKVNDLAGEFLQSVQLFQIALKLRKIALELCYDFLSVYAWCP